MYSSIAKNKRNSILFVIGFIVIFSVICVLVSLILGDIHYAYYAMAVIVAYVIFQYFLSIHLAVFMTGATPIEKQNNPALYRIVENLAITIGIPTPKIYIINDPSPNAFAAGKNPKDAIIGVTTGLLNIMDKQELEGVLAHEMGHIKNYDTRFSTIIFAMIAAIGLIVDISIRAMFGVRNNNAGPLILVILVILVILAPLSHFLQAASSREREYLADATGAEITRFPEGLASALNKLNAYEGPGLRKAPSSMSHLFFENPARKQKINWLDKMFATHPPLEDRVRRLYQMGGEL